MNVQKIKSPGAVTQNQRERANVADEAPPGPPAQDMNAERAAIMSSE
jgi:hypothetical protein